MPARKSQKSAVDKLHEQDTNGTPTGANAPEPEAKPAQPAKTAKPGLTRAQLEKAAKLKTDGKTWSQVREALGVKTRGPQFFAMWQREGIKAPPKADTGRRATKAQPAKPAAKPKAPAKARRRGGKANGPRTSNGKPGPVSTRKATQRELVAA